MGEECCEIELELLKGEEKIVFLRKLWKDGRHKLFINNEDIFENIKLRVISKFREEVKKAEKRESFSIEEIGGRLKLFTESPKDKFFINGDINEKIRRVLELKNHFIELKEFSGDSTDLFAIIEGIEEDDIKVDELNQFLADLGQSFSIYFNIIREEINMKYKEVGCLFEKKDIYSSLFQEYSNIEKDLYSDSSSLHNFILDKFGVNFIEKNLIYEEKNKLQRTIDKRIDIIYNFFDDPEVFELDDEMETLDELYEDAYDRESKILGDFENYFLNEDLSEMDIKDARRFQKYNTDSIKISDKIQFLNQIKDFLFELFSGKINKKLIELSKDYFKNEKFYSFLDNNGVPKIKFYERNEILPISCLSGGERSKVILILLSLLINISNKNSFFLIDEPNELLDPKNVFNMKQLFSKLFYNRQIIICTFIENYNRFRPALIYQVKKDGLNISQIYQIFPKIAEIKPDFSIPYKYRNIIKELINYEKQEELQLELLFDMPEIIGNKIRLGSVLINVTGNEDYSLIHLWINKNEMKTLLLKKLLIEQEEIFQNVILISGKNGVGKSNLIQILAFYLMDIVKFGKVLFDLNGEYSSKFNTIQSSDKRFKIFRFSETPTSNLLDRIKNCLTKGKTTIINLSSLDHKLLIKTITIVLDYLDINFEVKEEQEILFFFDDISVLWEAEEILFNKYISKGNNKFKFVISTQQPSRLSKEILKRVKTFITLDLELEEIEVFLEFLPSDKIPKYRAMITSKNLKKPIQISIPKFDDIIKIKNSFT